MLRPPSGDEYMAAIAVARHADHIHIALDSDDHAVDVAIDFASACQLVAALLTIVDEITPPEHAAARADS